MSIEHSRGQTGRCFVYQATAFVALIVVSSCGTGQATNPASHVALGSALQHALENNASGEAEQWQNPDTGDRGTIRPIRTFVSASGIPCREYDVAVMGGTSDSWRDVACRDTNGIWKDGG